MSRLTVGLPVYNAMPFLPETVESLLSQSYGGFDILIIDDGSTDGSSEYLDSLADNNRIKVCHQENRGLTATLNRMLEETCTPWLVRQDADDVAYPDRIERISRYIQDFPEAGMFYSMADYFPKGSCVGTFRASIAAPEVLRNQTRAGYLLSICHPTVCLNVEKTCKVGGYRFNLHVEDIDLWWRMALEYQIKLIPETLLGFRQNTGSVSQLNLERQAVNTLYIQYLLISHLWGLEPKSYENVVDFLGTLLDRSFLKFKESIRMTNIAFSKGQRGRAVGYALKSFISSPQSFMKRFAYEFAKDKAIVNGLNPLLFALNTHSLWGNDVK